MNGKADQRTKCLTQDPKRRLSPQQTKNASKDIEGLQPALKTSQKRIVKSKTLDSKHFAASEQGTDKSKLVKPLRYKKLDRVRRHADDKVTLVELQQRLTPYALLDKRNPREVTPELFDENSLNFQRDPEMSRKARKNVKDNKMMSFKSNRIKTMIRCVEEDKCMKIDNKLKNLFHKGTLNEDNDTDDSVQAKGIDMNYRNLKTALDQYKRKAVGKWKMSAREVPLTQLEVKSRKLNLPDSNIKLKNAESEADLNKPTKNIKRDGMLVKEKRTSRSRNLDFGKGAERKDSNSMEEESKSND